jgi:hypothetical protein
MGTADDLLIYLIAFIVLAVIVGFLLIWVVVSALRKGRQTAPKPEPKETPAPPAPAVVEKVEPPADKELLRVLRDMNSGAIYLEVEGRFYRSVTDIRSPEVSRLVQQVAAEMTRFARNVTPAVPTTGPLIPPVVPASGQSGLAARISSQASRTTGVAQPADGSLASGSPPGTGSLARRGEALIGSSGLSRPAPESAPTSTAPAPRLLSRTGKLGPPPEAPRKPITGPLSAPEEDRVDLGASKDSKPKVDLKSFWGRALSTPNTGSSIAGPRPLADELEDALQQLLHSMTKAPPFELHFKTASDGRLLIGSSYRL